MFKKLVFLILKMMKKTEKQNKIILKNKQFLKNKFHIDNHD